MLIKITSSFLSFYKEMCGPSTFESVPNWTRLGTAEASASEIKTCKTQSPATWNSQSSRTNDTNRHTAEWYETGSTQVLGLNVRKEWRLSLAQVGKAEGEGGLWDGMWVRAAFWYVQLRKNTNFLKKVWSFIPSNYSLSDEYLLRISSVGDIKQKKPTKDREKA